MSELDLTVVDEGVILAVKARPNARTNEIRDAFNGQLRVKVVQVAENGKANKSLVALLSKRLGIAKSRLEIVSGHASSNKRILIRGVTSEAVERLLLCG